MHVEAVTGGAFQLSIALVLDTRYPVTFEGAPGVLHEVTTFEPTDSVPESTDVT